MEGFENMEPKKTPEGWEARVTEVQRKYRALADLDLIKFATLFGEFGERLRQKYGAATDNCRLFHTLGGSGENEKMGKWTEFDFPGEDSIELFIDRLYQEFVVNKQKP